MIPPRFSLVEKPQRDLFVRMITERGRYVSKGCANSFHRKRSPSLGEGGFHMAPSQRELSAMLTEGVSDR